MKATTDNSSQTGARFPELADFLNEFAIQRGTFTLASGKTSHYYCDAKSATLHGCGMSLVSAAIVETLNGIAYDAIGGMELGAVPLVAGVIQKLYERDQSNVPGFIVRKELKSYGTKKRIEGPIPTSPSRLVMLEDVVTTGGSVVKAIDVVQAEGHEVVLVISILDRHEGGVEALAERNVPYQPLVTLADLRLSK